MYVYYWSVYVNGEAAIAVKTPWGRNVVMQTLWFRQECSVNAVQSPFNRCRPPSRSHGDLTKDSLRCQGVLSYYTELSQRLHGVLTAFFKGQRSNGVCYLQQNTNAVPRRSRRFVAMLAFCTAIWWWSRSPWERRPSVSGVLKRWKHLSSSIYDVCGRWTGDT
jgi:hypothetical protein